MSSRGERVWAEIKSAIDEQEARRQARRTVQERDGLRLLSPSACDGCDRANVYAILGTEPTNTTEILPVYLGTSIHENIEKALRERDPFGDTYLLEKRLPGLAERGLAGGNSDIIFVADKTLVDLKTIKRKSRRFFPGIGKARQVMLYAKMAREAGIEIDAVCLVGIMREGTSEDVITWDADFSEEAAEDALAHLESLHARAAAIRGGDESAWPRPDRPARTFCAPYCEFYGRCGGR